MCPGGPLGLVIPCGSQVRKVPAKCPLPHSPLRLASVRYWMPIWQVCAWELRIHSFSCGSVELTRALHWGLASQLSYRWPLCFPLLYPTAESPSETPSWWVTRLFKARALLGFMIPHQHYQTFLIFQIIDHGLPLSMTKLKCKPCRILLHSLLLTFMETSFQNTLFQRLAFASLVL